MRKQHKVLHNVSRSLPALMSVVAVVVVGLTGCTSRAVKKTVVEVNTRDQKLRTAVIKRSGEEDRIDARAYNQYVNGTIYEGMLDYVSAASSYKNALQKYPRSDVIRTSLARVLVASHQFEGALETLENIIDDDEEVLILRATCYRNLGQEYNASAEYLKLLKIDSQNTSAYSFLAGIYRRDAKADSVIWAYKHLTRLRSGNYRLWAELGNLYGQIRSYEKAKSALRKSIEIKSDETNAISIIRLGEVYEASGHMDSALIQYNRAIKVVPEDIQLNGTLATLYARMDSVVQAIPFAEKVVAKTPYDKAAVRRLGLVYYLADSLDKASSTFLSLVEIGDRHPVNYLYLGQIAMIRKEFESGRDYFISLTKVADSLPESWLNLGAAYRRLEQPDEEVHVYEQGLNHMRTEKDALPLLFSLGASHERAGLYEKAIETFEELIARVPDHAQALNYLGYMLAEKGDRLDYAGDLIERALAISPNNAAFLDSYGWVFYQQGKYEEALVQLNKAVSLDSDPVIFDHLGDAYKAAGKMESAIEWWQKALELKPDDQKILEKLGN